MAYLAMTSLPAEERKHAMNGSVTTCTNGGGPVRVPTRKFTWRELSKLNEPHNAHVAYRGKVSQRHYSCLLFKSGLVYYENEHHTAASLGVAWCSSIIKVVCMQAERERERERERSLRHTLRTSIFANLYVYCVHIIDTEIINRETGLPIKFYIVSCMS